MDKRSEIRKEIGKIIRDNIAVACSEFGGDTDTETQEEVTEIIEYLHSQGVVIKILQKYPLQPLYIYEPLIEN